MLEFQYPLLNIQEYLVLEETSEIRHEYVEGYIYAMAGGTNRHNRIALNIAAHFLSLASGRCRVYQEGMKLHLSEKVFYYLDVMVICEKSEPHPLYETEPCILIEVLSPSTKDIDVREKLLNYTSLPSMQMYLLVDAERLAVRHMWRDTVGHCQQQELAGDGEITLPCLNGVLTLAQIYRNVF
jgi:Uma2 family endonuclease